MELHSQLMGLVALGRGLLNRLYDFNVWRSNPYKAPEYFTDSKYTKVNKQLLARYPEQTPTEKVTGVEVYQKVASTVVDEMLPWFHVFVDAASYQKLAIEVLSSLVEITAPFQYSVSPFISEQFNEVYTLYVQVLLLLNELEDKKTFMAVFALCHRLAHSKLHPDYQKIVDFFAAYDLKKLWPRIREEFKPLAPHIFVSLAEFAPLYSKALTTLDLRQSAKLVALSPAHELGTIFQNPMLPMLRLDHRVYTWIIIGILAIPEYVTEDMITLAKTALAKSPVMPLFRDITFDPHDEAIEAFSNVKNKHVKLSKHVDAIKKTRTASLADSGAARKAIRTYLRHELSTMLLLLRDCPGLLGPRFETVLTLLSLAKQEILWYFRHANLKSKSKHFDAESFQDNRVSELISLNFQLLELIQDYRPIIVEYYVKYLRGCHLNKLEEFSKNPAFIAALGTEGSEAFKVLIDAFSKCSPASQFDHARQLWYKAQMAFAYRSPALETAQFKTELVRIEYALQHTAFVDSLQLLLSEHASLRELWYFRETFVSMFERAIVDGPDQPSHCMAFISLCSHFPENANPFFAAEREMIGLGSVELASKFLRAIINRIAELIEAIAHQNFTWDNASSEQAAVFSIMAKRPGYVPDKHNPPPPPPGSESIFANRLNNRAVQLYQRNLQQLCTALTQFSEFVVYDTTLVPMEFLIDTIENMFKSFIQKSIESAKGKSIRPPAVFTRYIYSYACTLREIENYLDVDITSLINSVLMAEVYDPDLGPSDRSLQWVTAEVEKANQEVASMDKAELTRDFLMKNTSKVKDTVSDKVKEAVNDISGAKGDDPILDDKTKAPTQSFMSVLVQYYADILKKLTKGARDIMYSRTRHGFVSRKSELPPAEAFLDLEELKSLCRMVGPYGIKQLDRECIKALSLLIKSLEPHLQACKMDLLKLQASRGNDDEFYAAIKALKQRGLDFDTFTLKSISIGNVLYFRRLIHEALRQVAEERVPLILNAVAIQYSQYPTNYWAENHLVASDQLAFDIGIDAHGADQELRAILLPLVQKESAGKIWDLLYVMYAASFEIATQWKEAQYNALFGGHENSVHVLVRTIDDLCSTFTALGASANSYDLIHQRRVEFVRLASDVLLRMADKVAKDRTSMKDYASLVVFIDMFVEDTKSVTRDILDEIIPFTMLRTMWRHLVAKQEDLGIKGK